MATVRVRERPKISSRTGGFAHRLDCGRVLCVPDGTLCPAVIGGRRLRSRWNSRKV